MLSGLDAIILARIQFAFTVSFHFIFPAFSIGLASYLAVLEGRLPSDCGRLTDHIERQGRLSRIALQATAASREARLSYRVLETADDRSLVEVELETGRKHQIRLQLAHIGCPIIGDDKYGDRVGNRSFPAGLRLTATRIVFPNKLDGLEYFCGKSIEIEPPYNTQLIKNQL